ncbi:uncharacterized protein LOC114759675 [Neltuma alba]|uniref:uncharacterized protein LOC114759675 n=1 Tax=Neltuma alba TaxID=207710 RepID=UPI0010A55232|nr:uncharacterized protein LOC114759675 [Prosopis alba]
MAQSRQKSYADMRRRPLEFKVGDHVFLKVSPTMGVGRSIEALKLTLKFIRSFQISSRVGPVSYRLTLPLNLSQIHNIFHVSQLKKYQPNPSHVLKYEDMELRDNLTFEVKLVKVIDRQIKQLWNKAISMVKVIRRDQTQEEAMWEKEDDMKIRYLELFK